MMNTLRLSVLLLLGLCSMGPLWSQDEKAEGHSELVDQLRQADLQKIFGLLQEQHVERERLNHEEINRAAVLGLLHRLDSGAELVPLAAEKATKEETPPNFVAEVFSEHTAYLRPVLAKEAFSETEAALKEFREKGIANLLLDLRLPDHGDDFTGASLLLDALTNDEAPLFEIRKAGEDEGAIESGQQGTLWYGRILILVDESTGPEAEVVASVLRAGEPETLAVGTTTAGRAAHHEVIPLSETTALRMAVAEVRLPEGNSLYRQPIEPEVVVPLPAKVRDELGARFAKEGVLRWSAEEPRPRFSEAALVAGTNPDIDYAASMHGKKKPAPEKRDLVIQRATDIVKARIFLDAKPGATAR